MNDIETVQIGESSFKQEVTSLQNIIKGYRKQLEGYVWVSEQNFMPTGEPLCDSRIINKLVGLLSPFTHSANLITIKDYSTFCTQQYYLMDQVNKVLNTSEFMSAKEYTEILQITDDTLQNIGDIILGSKPLMERAMITDDNNLSTSL